MPVNIGGIGSRGDKLMAALHLEEDQRDLSLVCGDSSVVRCHQVILSLHSTFLQSLLSGLSCGGPSQVSLLLPGSERGAVVALLEYLYTGSCLADSQTLTQLTELQAMLCLDIEMTAIPPADTATKTRAQVVETAKENQKRITLDIMMAIEQIKSGVTKLQCTECGQALLKDNFLIHYRSHMQSYSKIVQDLEESTSSGHGDLIKEESVDESVIESHDNSASLEELGNTSDNEVHDSKEAMVDVVESVEVTDFDQEEYEKLVKGEIHSRILRRKRRQIGGSKGLVLVSELELEEENVKEPGDKAQDYARLKVQRLVKSLHEKKRRFGIGVSMITDEEIQQAIDRENQKRKVKLVIDIQRARQGRSSRSDSVWGVNILSPSVEVSEESLK